jgi:hypothetical protein
MIVKDNYLDNYLYSELLNSPNFFPTSMGNEEKIAAHLMMYHEESSSSYSPFMFWDGWWRSPANTLKKKIIQKIWEENLEWPNEDILGFEYWTRTYNPGQYIDLHVDEDTFLYFENKIFQGPITGCVYYGVDNKDGGFLEIHKNSFINGNKESLEKENIKEYISPKEDRERISYKGNRLIIFDAGHRLHSSTPAKSNIRQVMVINVWHKDNPPIAISNGSFFYE